MAPPEPTKGSQETFRLLRQVGMLASIPTVLVGGPTIGFIVGRFLDRRLNSDPWGVAVSVLVGFAAGAAQTVRLIHHAQRKTDS